MVKNNKRRKIFKRKKLAEYSGLGGASPNEQAIDFGSKRSIKDIGSSGTDITGGYFNEESLKNLTGQKGAQTYEDMRRREAVVSMILGAIKNPIMGATFDFEIEDETDEMQLKMKQLCEWNFFHALEGGWKEFLVEAFTFVDKGFSLFEIVHKTDNVPQMAVVEKPEMPEMPDAEDPEEDDSEEEATSEESTDEETDTQSGGAGPLVTFYHKFAFRKQTSIYRWKLEKKTGRLISIEQQTTGDTSEQSIVTIPGQFCLVFSNQKEGDNYEGISILRAIYGAYIRKDLYLRLTAIGAEKNAVGTAIGTTPAGKINAAEQARFEAVLEAYAGNESSYLVKPTGYEVEIQYGEFDPSKMVTLLNFEDEQMAKAVLATFLSLGSSGNSGSLAVGATLSNFFMQGIQIYADVFTDKINREAIPSLCMLNYGPQKCYPKLKCTGINDKAGKELAEIITSLISSQSIKPDDKLEDFLRMRYKLPKADPMTAREKAAPLGTMPSPDGTCPVGTRLDPRTGKCVPTGKAPDAPAEDSTAPGADAKKEAAVKQAEKKSLNLADYIKQFDKNKAATKEVMQSHLTVMAADLVKQLRKNYNDATDSQKVNAIKDVGVRAGMISKYKEELRGVLAETAAQAIAQARKEVPKAARDVKFASTYEKLNPLVRRAIEAQLGLVVETQTNDLTKIVLFQWSSSASSSDDVDAIANDVEERIKPVLEGSSNAGMSIEAASGDLTAQVTQNSRNEFFFAPDVLDTLESFTFFNEDPISEICQNLNGQTFSVSDPAAEQFYPPLHHNCKSRLVPNEKGSGEEITGIGIVADSTDERARLEKQITFCGCEPYKFSANT